MTVRMVFWMGEYDYIALPKEPESMGRELLIYMIQQQLWVASERDTRL